MTDNVYQMVQYPLKKVVRVLTELEDLSSLPPEQLSPELREEVKNELASFIDFWEEEGRWALKDLINNLRNQD